MRVFQGITTAALLVLVIGTFNSVTARTVTDAVTSKQFDHSKSTASPELNIAAHRVGHIGLAVTNTGTFGKGFYPGANIDFFTGEPINNSCEYPIGSNTEYLYAASLWIGAVVGNDTLVSTGADGWSSSGAEMYPDEAPFGGMIKRSTLDPTSPLFVDAVSHEDYIAVYMDTTTEGVPPDWTGRPHIPLNIEVTQSSFAWGYAWTEDFVLIDYQIKNIGQEVITETFIGLYVDADVCYDCNGGFQGFSDDLTGFLETYPTTVGNCEFLDTLNMAWIADNDGDFLRYYPDGLRHPTPDVTATKVLRMPAESPILAYNWWVSNNLAYRDFGPRLKGTPEDPFRDFGTGSIGTPDGDNNKHYIMRHAEFDYDQAYTATIQASDANWMYPNQVIADDIADGFDTRYLLSFGPFDILPGQTLPMTIAYVAGENLHTSASNIANLPDNPDAYYSNLDFSDLAINARWADWVYDNPGVDTDQDGYFGKFRVCCDGDVCDTFFYEGDGVPDFSATPSLAGRDMVWVEPREEALWVRWNGLHAETERDMLSRRVDFEGYNVYLARNPVPASFVLIESYDLENYLKYVFSPIHGWEIRDYPFLPDLLRCLYGDSCTDPSFDPLDYTESSPYILPGFPDSVFYFAPFGLNLSELGTSGTMLNIYKLYPDEPYPTTLDPSQADPGELTPDGYFKYFEYGLLIDGLLPTVPYYVDIKRTDHGAPHFGIPGDVRSLTGQPVLGFPLSSGPPAFDYDQGWNLISAPVDLDSPLPSDVFGDDLPFWQLFGWNGSSYYSPTEVTGCGDAYWLLVPEAASVDYEGIDCAPLEPPVCVATSAGWNMLGSPYDAFAALADARYHAASETVDYTEALTRGWISLSLYEWSASTYVETGVIEPGRGCWFAVVIDGLDICWYPSYEAPQRDPGRDLFAAGNEQILTISLLGTSESVHIGIHEEATQGFDSKFDLPSPPPAPGAKASLVILSTDGIWSQLKTDMRPFEDELIWPLRVQSINSGALEFTDVSSLTQLGYSITLVNSSGQNLATIDKDQTVKVEPGNYSIVANRTGAGSTQIPSAYALASNYPNPFNPSTTIAYALPVAGQVRLAVYNLLGQRIAILVDESKPAGWHDVTWNGHNDDGSVVSSGVYFYRLETDGFVQSRKMLLIK